MFRASRNTLRIATTHRLNKEIKFLKSDTKLTHSAQDYTPAPQTLSHNT